MSFSPDVALELVVETPRGLMVRRVPRASALGGQGNQGTEAEAATKSAVARWGLPDFAFDAIKVRKGNATREVGDALLVCSGFGLVVQVKSRSAPSGDAGAEQRWVEKNVRKGLSQAAGSIRLLTSQTVRAFNQRGSEVTIDGASIEWLPVIIVDHAEDPKVVIAAPEGSQLARVVLLRRDWEFLFDQLRSTYAVMEYLRRVAPDPDVLGQEAVRYYDLAQADEDASPDPLDPAIYGQGTPVTGPLLPKEPVGGEGTLAHLVVRIIMEDIAVSPDLDARQRHLVLAELDQLLVRERAELGRHLLDQLDALRHVAPGKVGFRLRYIRGAPPAPQLVFAAASTHTDMVVRTFEERLMLRHHEFGNSTGQSQKLITVGVLLTPRSDGERPWDTTMIRVEGSLELSDSDLAILIEKYGAAALVHG